MNVMNWESKRNDFLIWMRLCYANGAVFRLSWDRVSSLWFWLSNCLVFKVVYLHVLHVIAKCCNCTIVLTRVEKYTIQK